MFIGDDRDEPPRDRQTNLFAHKVSVALVIRVHGDTAIMQGTSKVRAVSGGVEATVNLRFLLVYVREGGRWQFAAWQSTRLP